MKFNLEDIQQKLEKSFNEVKNIQEVQVLVPALEQEYKENNLKSFELYDQDKKRVELEEQLIEVCRVLYFSHLASGCSKQDCKDMILGQKPREKVIRDCFEKRFLTMKEKHHKIIKDAMGEDSQKYLQEVFPSWLEFKKQEDESKLKAKKIRKLYKLYNVLQSLIELWKN